ncbi:MAG: hypothetical protein KJ718_03760 [Nanoarchaeota archaeon]|nr:hypothetical protein [Nanoarchaeota archaeon]MBU1051647.1 hypothetical protein [Nanoarchaeota archaeon]MBU1987938.1 hypothetical protein [Nanoarchaeota archaeon]
MGEFIPTPVVCEGRHFSTMGSMDKSLAECQSKGYTALFMPEYLDAQIVSPRDSTIFDTGAATLSMIILGKTRQKNPVAIYAHIPHHFSVPENIKRVIEAKRVVGQGFGIIPMEEFERLLKMEDNERVFVVDYGSFNEENINSIVPVKRALEHPQTIPFLGGEDRARKYLKKHKEVYGTKNIRINVQGNMFMPEEPAAGFLNIWGRNCLQEEKGRLNATHNILGPGGFFGAKLKF